MGLRSANIVYVYTLNYYSPIQCSYKCHGKKSREDSTSFPENREPGKEVGED